MRLEWEIRRRHVAGLLKYLREEKRTGLHVTDLVHGCLRYAAYQYVSRELEAERSIDEGGVTRLAIGKLLDSIPVGDWHHVDLRFDGLQGQIDDVMRYGDDLVIIDKKTVAESPPRDVHDHYMRQVQYYAAMLKYGEIVGCETGDLELLKQLVAEARRFILAVLYVDVSASTKTRVSDVKVWIIDEDVVNDVLRELRRMVKRFYETKAENSLDVMKFEPNPGWICQYCPIMNICWSEAG